MKTSLKKMIIGYISENDKNGNVVKKISPNADYSGGKIEYNKNNLVLHREVTSLSGDGEEYVRAYLAVKLVKELRYPLNKCIEFEKEYSIGHPSTKRARVDILVKDDREKGAEKFFLFIECKAPEKYEDKKKNAIENQLFKLAPQEQTVNNAPVKYLGYYTVKIDRDRLRDTLLLIDFEEFPSLGSWQVGGEKILDVLPEEYGIAKKSTYINKEDDKLKEDEKNLDKTKDRKFFDSLKTDLHNKVWGGSTEYNYIFSNLSRLFLAKIYDEMVTLPGEAYRFQIVYKEEKEKKIKPENPSETFERINNLFVESLQYLGYTPQELEYERGLDRRYVDENKVAYVTEQLQGISITENEHLNGDILGDFFEGIVAEGYKQDKGTFFTHKNIVHFIQYGLKLDKLAVALASGKEDPIHPRLPYICDPACGSGTFLIEGMKIIEKAIHTPGAIPRSRYVQSKIESWFTRTRPHQWAAEFVYGIEKNYDLALSTKVNMVLHGDGNINIFAKDGLLPFEDYAVSYRTHEMEKASKRDSYLYKYEVNERFDVVVSNPPFSVPLDTNTRNKLSGRFVFSNNRNSETLFIERYYQLLKENGRLGVVMPESVFDTRQNLSVRLFLYRYFQICAIVSLPYLAFNPFTSTKTSLIFARKKTREEVELYNKRWRIAANEYNKLLKSKIMRFALENYNIHQGKNGLMKLCNDLEVSYQPLQNTLTPKMFDEKFQATLGDRAIEKDKEDQTGDKWQRKVERIIKKIITHFEKIWFIERLRDLKSIKKRKDDEENLKILKCFLRNLIDQRDNGKTLWQLIDKYLIEIAEVATINDDVNSHCNAWWVFREIMSDPEFDSEIFMAEAEEIGYKRGKRKTDGSRPNDLFSRDEKGDINPDDPSTTLGQLRKKDYFDYC